MRPRILIVNDDSLYASGIAHLLDAVRDLGEILVVAPENPCSAKSHSITLDYINYKKVEKWAGIESYACSGTPADCVKLALSKFYRDTLPDICLSGINHGPNHTIATFYSGTMAAAIEAHFYGVCAVGFSYEDICHDADFSQIKVEVRGLVQKILTLPDELKKSLLLNVNIPFHSQDLPLRGVRVVRQGRGQFYDRLEKSAQGYFPTGWFENFEPKAEDTDFFALANRYISVVPLQIDLTDYARKDLLKKLWEEK